jgi:DNA polymerase-3 subunit alpha
LEALIYAGAFDSLNEGNRATLFASIDNALNFAKFTHLNNDMDSLFSSAEVEKTVTGPKLIVCEEWTVKEKFAKEKEFLDFYVSGHPMDRYKNLVTALSTLKLDDIRNPLIVDDDFGNFGGGYNRYSKNNNLPKVRVCGIIEDLRTRLTKKNATVAFANITDFKGKGELIFASKSWENLKTKVKDNEISLCVGTAKHNKDAIKIVVQEVYDLFEAIDKFARGLEIMVQLSEHSTDDIEELSKLCTGISNKKEIVFVISDDKVGEQRKYLSEDINLPVNEYTVNKIINIFGIENINLLLSM